MHLVSKLLLLLTSALCLGATIGLRASDPPDLKQQVERLLRDLDADTLAQRRAAERVLKELGPAVLPLLPPPELVSSSARETLSKVRFELERRLARESVAPSRIALKGTESLEYWLGQFTSQTGNRLDVSLIPTAQRQKRVTLDLQPTDFWTALDQICRAEGLEILLGPRGGVVLQPKSRNDVGPVGSAGAFRTSISSVQRTSGLDGNEDLLRLRLQLLAEPRLRPLFVKFAMQEMRVVGSTSTGEAEPSQSLPSLLPLSPEARTELLMSESRLAADPRLDFRLPHTDRRTHVDFKGRFMVTVAAGSEEIRFTNLAELAAAKMPNVSRRRGGVTVTLKKIALAPQADNLQTAKLELVVTWDSVGPAFESHRSWLLNNRVFLESAPAGEKREKQIRELNGGLETTAQSDGSVGVSYSFRDLPNPLPDETLVYVAPTLIIDVPVDVELKHIPVLVKRNK